MNNSICIDFKNINNNAPFLLAVSGGLDSMVMLDYFVNNSLLGPNKICVAHVNYQKHNQANNSEVLVLDYCNKINVPIFILRINEQMNKGSFEDIARKIRYNFFKKLYNKFSYKSICTAHHKNDQIETLFMKYKLKADFVSMSGIVENIGKIWRPFLHLEKLQLKNYAIKNNLTWIDDPTNKNINYLRNRIRKIDFPNAINQNPDIINILFKKKLYSDQVISEINKKFKKQILDKDIIIKKYLNQKIIIFRKLKELSLTEIKLFLHFTLNKYYDFEFSGLTKSHWKTLWQYVENSNSGSKFVIKGKYIIINDRDKFCLTNSFFNKKLSRKKIVLEKNNWINGSIIVKSSKICDNNRQNLFIISEKDWTYGLYIRPWEKGDRINIINSKKSKKISDIFINNKLSVIEKKMYPVIVNKRNDPIWLPGLRHSSCYPIPNETNQKYIKWKPL